MSKDKLWAGRSKISTDQLLDKFNASFPFDFALWKHDLLGSKAHVKMLGATGIIHQEEAIAISQGLEEIESEISKDQEGWFKANSHFEDIHSAIEARLIALTGDVGRKLHTARSRNDQVATDIKLFLRDENLMVLDLLQTLLETLLKLAERHADVLLPGYTHLQKAQPISLGHHWLAHFERFFRDYKKLQNAFENLNWCPLGSGALAGTTYQIDRHLTAKELSFNGPTHNSLDSVSDRDFIAEHQFVFSLMMVHLSQLSEELILWATDEFKYIELDDKFATGSSMMPQKKNPDVPELVRGKSGRVIGNLVSLLTTLKGLPIAYNKDLQEDKEGLFDSLKTVKISLKITDKFLQSIKINAERMKKATETGFLNATDAADFLVKKGVSFREAYKSVGEAVAFCIQNSKDLESLTTEQWQSFHKAFSDEVKDAIKIKNCLYNRISFGGTSPTKVREQITEGWERLKK